MTVRLALILALGLWVSACDDVPSADRLTAETFQRLEEIRTARKQVVLDKLDRLRTSAEESDSDPVLIEAFTRFQQTSAQDLLTGNVNQDLEDRVDHRYVEAYGDFYDILFIDDDGHIFYTLKLESDFDANIFEGTLANTRLAKDLPTITNFGFIDYDFYSPSSEAAAFFVTRIETSEANGWIVLQFPANALASALADVSGLGRTGETYITNQAHVMLTQSRLLAEDTVLNLKVETEATQRALQHVAGESVLQDYRGVSVFSSYEKFSALGAPWIIITEIDEDEVLTEHYLANRDYYAPLLVKGLNTGITTPQPKPFSVHQTVRVDINEYARATKSQTLQTKGISTCTGFAIALPSQSAYLGHIYPLDAAYRSDWQRHLVGLGLEIRGLGDVAESDLLGDMLDRIRRYEITPAEIRNLRVTLAAVHTKSFAPSIDRLLESGLFLSQINFLHGPDMRYVNLSMDAASGDVLAEWVGPDGETQRWTRPSDTVNLGHVIKQVSGYRPNGLGV